MKFRCFGNRTADETELEKNKSSNCKRSRD